ncbi:YYY domain containing protein [Pectobacterium bacteriophage PM2]|uniref:YYY domain containing protein n=1 Tax=Pectobacterium bacteriophage PM2 TaxID=1429794 RepID=A0A0A0Q2G7_9CAUD|nr:YYY domain containing protein [Pectobacterium bacteriophage PM2]AHY25165.1 YYY domain containing protein [Pectobacterium bacteriophage PM2]
MDIISNFNIINIPTRIKLGETIYPKFQFVREIPDGEEIYIANAYGSVILGTSHKHEFTISDWTTEGNISTSTDDISYTATIEGIYTINVFIKVRYNGEETVKIAEEIIEIYKELPNPASLEIISNHPTLPAPTGENFTLSVRVGNMDEPFEITNHSWAIRGNIINSETIDVDWIGPGTEQVICRATVSKEGYESEEFETYYTLTSVKGILPNIITTISAYGSPEVGLAYKAYASRNFPQGFQNITLTTKWFEITDSGHIPITQIGTDLNHKFRTVGEHTIYYTVVYSLENYEDLEAKSKELVLNIIDWEAHSSQ